MFDILGPIHVYDNETTTELRGRGQRTLLAALLVNQSRPMSSEALVDELWPGEPPAGADNALQAHVSRLRRNLAKIGRRDCLELTPTGYRLNVPDEEVDVRRFLRAIERARASMSAPGPECIDQLRSALTLWRGQVFGGPLGDSVCAAAVARYNESYSYATEILFDMELNAGRHREALPELSAVAASSNLDESICAKLMIALYRSGRQTEALAAFHGMRQRLDEELGVAPSPRLQYYERAILNHDRAILGNDPVSTFPVAS